MEKKIGSKGTKEARSEEGKSMTSNQEEKKKEKE
jgi:hypothetical protein